MKQFNYKILIWLIKYTPVVCSAGVFANIILQKFGIFPAIISFNAGISTILILILYFGNKVFQFCKWHITLIIYLCFYLSIIAIDYYFPKTRIINDYIDVIIIISVIIFGIAFKFRNKCNYDKVRFNKCSSKTNIK